MLQCQLFTWDKAGTFSPLNPGSLLWSVLGGVLGSITFVYSDSFCSNMLAFVSPYTDAIINIPIVR